MNAFGSVISPRKIERYLPWIAGTVLAVGVVVFLVTQLPNKSPSTDNAVTPKSQIAAQQAKAKPQKSVPLSPDVRLVAGKFILTNVARRNLAQGWELTAPALRQGMSRKEWLTGNIPVVPYRAQLDKVPLKIDWSYRNDAQLRVVLIPKAGAKVDGKPIKPQLFIIALHKFGKGKNARWLVTSWTPYSAPIVPNANG